MKILTIGDSWTYGEESSDPAIMSWPAQMARNHKVKVTNLARSGSSNQRAMRIGLEELCRNNRYDYVIWPLSPAPRTEILKQGKWHQIWPGQGTSHLDKIYTEFWTPWNDVQTTIMLVLQFSLALKAMNIPLYIAGLSLSPFQYSKEMSWITNYKDDFEFEKLGMPVNGWDIGTLDLDRKLKSLRAMHNTILTIQPDYWFDIIKNYYKLPEIPKKYGYKISKGHPGDLGYYALSEFFADKIGLTANSGMSNTAK